MSVWQFILIDDNDNLTEVDNPRGWNSAQVKISRDQEWYGIFFDYLFDTLEFHGTGAQLIKNEYDTKGLRGSMRLRINFFCSDGESWDLFYEGRLAFPRYRDTCGDQCVVTIGLEQDNDIMLLRNNYEQSVNLNSGVAFDQTTALTNYSGINYSLTIPGRGIPLKTQGTNAEPHAFSLLDFPTWGNIAPNGATGAENGGFLPIFDTTNYAEFQNTSLPGSAFYDTTIQFNAGNNSVAPPPVLDIVRNPSLKCQPSDTMLEYRIKGRLIDNSNATRSVGAAVNIWIGPNPAEALFYNSNPLFNYEAGSFLTTEFDASLLGPVNLNAGDKLYLYIQIGYVKLSSAALQQLTVEFDMETNILVTGLSVCEDTEANVYLINEATSRITEAITNGAVRFYSTFFGRTDSMPYALPNDTCAGLHAIVNGINLRRRVLNDGGQPGCFVTLRNIFESLRSMWNIGAGIEPDLNRPGFNRYRFEDWRFFFQDEVGLIFNYPTNIERRVNPARAYSRFQTGYTKWENEQYSGLNEFMTDREYRNGINAVDTLLDRRSTWIHASYTAEIARRQDTGTEDYRYDNDIFGFCLSRDGAGLQVEQLGDIGSDIQNIADPSTCYNGRVSPARNAMRWFNCFMQALKQLQNTDKMLFTKGTGNYVAQFALQGDCEIAGAPIVENQDIDVFDFADTEEAKPIVYPEDLVFQHPLNYNLFKRIKADPTLKYKSILVNCNGTYKSAWLMDLTYTPELGLATITTWPKNDTQLPQPPPPEMCEATITSGSITMDSWDYAAQTAEIDFTEGMAGATFWYYIVTQGPNPGSGTGFSGSTSVHPFTVNGITPGQWSVMIIPYCGPEDVGQNYGTGTFNFEAPPISIELSAVLTEGLGSNNDNNRLDLTGTSGVPVSAGFSFSWGHCAVNTSSGIESCKSYPGSLTPTPTNTLIFNAGQTTVTQRGQLVTPGASFGTITKIVVFNMTGITAAQISKAVGQLWTLEFM